MVVDGRYYLLQQASVWGRRKKGVTQRLHKLWKLKTVDTTQQKKSNFWQLHLSPELQLWHGYDYSPLCQPSMGNATHVETDCVRHLPGSWQSHSQGHYNCVVMEIFMPLMATGDSLTNQSWVVRVYRIMVVSLDNLDQHPLKLPYAISLEE